MVCVPCFIIPLLIFIWHKFIQPYVLRFWNPWAVKDADGNVVKDADGNVKTEFPFNCEGGVCAFRKKPIEKEPAEKEQKECLRETKPCTDDRLKAE